LLGVAREFKSPLLQLKSYDFLPQISLHSFEFSAALRHLIDGRQRKF